MADVYVYPSVPLYLCCEYVPECSYNLDLDGYALTPENRQQR